MQSITTIKVTGKNSWQKVRRNKYNKYSSV